MSADVNCHYGASLAAHLRPSSTKSRLAGLLPIPNSSSAKAFFALGVISLFFLLIVSCPPASPDTLRNFELELSAGLLPGLEAKERLLGNEMGEGGSGKVVK